MRGLRVWEQDMFQKAKTGDKDAVEELQRLFAAEHFPGREGGHH